MPPLDCQVLSEMIPGARAQNTCPETFNHWTMSMPGASPLFRCSRILLELDWNADAMPRCNNDAFNLDCILQSACYSGVFQSQFAYYSF